MTTSSGSKDSDHFDIYRYAFDNNALPILVSELQSGKIVDVNPTLCNWVELPREALVGTHTVRDQGWFTPTVRQRLIEGLVENGGFSDSELTINLANLGKRICAASAKTFWLGERQILVTTYKDITDERTRQRGIEENERHLQILADLEALLLRQPTPQAILQTTIEFLRERLAANRAWLLTPCDPAAEWIQIAYDAIESGYEELQIKSPIPVTDALRALIINHLNSDDPISYGKNQDTALPEATGRDQQILSRLVIAIQPATGDPWLLGLHQYDHPRDWTNSDKHLLKSLAARITDRLNTVLLLEQLEQSEERYRELFESAPESISLIDADSGQFIEFNPATTALLGYDEPALMQKTVVDISDPFQAAGDAETIYRRLIDDALSGATQKFEWRYLHANGSPVYAEVQLKLTSRDKSLIRATVTDVTERRNLEEQLRQAHKMEAVGQLAGGIAHDFNNLLQGILGFADLLLERGGLDETQQRQINHVHEAATRAATLTKQLLAFGRRQVLDKRNVDLNELISSQREVTERIIGRHIEYEFIPGHDLGSVLSDPVQLEQILLNLYLNARDAMVDGGVLTVETENVLITEEYCRTHGWATPGRFVLISVSDSGKGMDAKTLEQIFEPFFTTKDSGGSGLGLSMAYGIVQQHGGMIQAYSEPGVGTTFKVYLPQSERPAVNVGPKLVGPVKRGNETILVAEDDETIVELIEAVLGAAGYKILMARNGEEAVQIYRQHGDQIALALLDVIMPRMGGKQCMEELRQLNPQVRCLFASGYSNNGVHTDFVLKEGLQLLQKPFTPSELLREIRSILDS